MPDEILYNSAKLAENIKAYAKSQKLSLKSMLEACGLGVNAMSGMYHGKAIAFDSLARIADYLDVSLDQLVGRSASQTDKSKIQEAKDRYLAEKVEEFKIRVQKGEKAVIQARAEELDKSVNKYVVDLIHADIDSDSIINQGAIAAEGGSLTRPAPKKPKTTL